MTSTRTPLGRVLAAVRPTAWVLDLIVLAPLLYSGRLLDPPSIQLAGATLLAFGLISVNASLLDAWRTQHDKVLLGTAAIFAALGLALASSLATRTPPLAAEGLGAYDVLNWCLIFLALSVFDVLLLARIAVVDVLSAATRLLLRPLAGAAVLQLTPLPGLLGLTAALGLYLAFATRYLEFAQAPAPAADDFVSLDTRRLFDRGVVAGVVLVVVAWIGFSFSARTITSVGSHDLVWITPLVAWIAWRHAGHIRRGAVPQASGKRFVSDDAVAMLLADRVSGAALLIWFAATLQVVYRPF
jgi:hypothetical protein